VLALDALDAALAAVPAPVAAPEISAVLERLRTDGLVTYAYHNAEEERVTVVLPLSYKKGDPNAGLDGASRALSDAVTAALFAAGWEWWDAQMNIGGGEAWIYTPAT
jgi:hypothetical protein